MKTREEIEALIKDLGMPVEDHFQGWIAALEWVLSYDLETEKREIEKPWDDVDTYGP